MNLPLTHALYELSTELAPEVGRDRLLHEVQLQTDRFLLFLLQDVEVHQTRQFILLHKAPIACPLLATGTTSHSAQV